MMGVDETAALQAENQALRQQGTALLAEVAALHAQVAAAQAELAAVHARIAELEQRPPDPPSFVKANSPPRERQPRRKRKPEQNRARRLAAPTRIEQHALERCPDCGLHLHGGMLARRRQVIEIPEPQPVEVVEHQVIKRWCAWCKRWQAPKLDLRGQVLGQSRLGVRIASLIAYLRTTLRLPIRRIQAYLQTVHHLSISIGEIVELLHQVRRATQPTVEGLKAQARASPILHADETGWREAGQNGHVWAFSTPGEEAVRYYEFDPSRAGAVAKRILGKDFHGHLVSDFYGGYNIYAGKHQRCWVHFLRDLHALREAHAADEAVVAWVAAVRKLYEAAQAFVRGAEPPGQEAREAQYVALVEQVHALGLQYARAYTHPCNALAKRILRHEAELFQFVLVAGLSADNNLAERSIRPVVVVRKISGGTQSAEGSKTRMALASLFETWQARGLNPFEECLKLLRQTPLPQV
jgi:transposase